MLKIAKVCTQITKKTTATCTIRNVSCTAVRAIDQKWREEQGLPKNPNAFGALTNMPDYTFLDGRTTPLGSNQKKRLIKQQEITAKIITYNAELKFAKDRFARIKSAEAAEKKRIMDSKLKPKGYLLLKQK